MIIYKHLDHVTDAERAELDRLDIEHRNLLNRMDTVYAEALAIIDGGEKEKGQAILRQFLDEYMASNINGRIDEINGAIEARYIESLNGDFNLIMADIREILTAITKADYDKFSASRIAQSVDELKYKKAERVKPYKKGFNTFRFFLAMATRIQYNAMLYSGINVNAITDLINQRAAEFYKNPKAKRTAKVEQILTEPLTERNYYDLPSSATTHLYYRVLTAGKNLEQLEARLNAGDRHNKAELLTDKDQPNAKLIRYTSRKSEVEIAVENVNLLTTSNAAVVKLYLFILAKMNQQALVKGKLIKNTIVFSLDEFAKIAGYSSTVAARTAFQNSKEVITSIKLRGAIPLANMETTSPNALVVPFDLADIVNGNCIVGLSERINWEVIAPQFMQLPTYDFKLSPKPSALLYYIFYLARQNRRAIVQDGFFNINLKTIALFLGLPDEETAKNPQRDIRDVIASAVMEITSQNDPNLTITLCHDSNANITNYLKTGSLKVELRGDYLEPLITITANNAKIIDNREAKRIRIEEKAHAINLSKIIKEKSKAAT